MIYKHDVTESQGPNPKHNVYRNVRLILSEEVKPTSEAPVVTFLLKSIRKGLVVCQELEDVGGEEVSTEFLVGKQDGKGFKIEFEGTLLCGVE